MLIRGITCPPNWAAFSFDRQKFAAGVQPSQPGITLNCGNRLFPIGGMDFRFETGIDMLMSCNFSRRCKAPNIGKKYIPSRILHIQS